MNSYTADTLETLYKEDSSSVNMFAGKIGDKHFSFHFSLISRLLIGCSSVRPLKLLRDWSKIGGGPHETADF